MMTGLENRLKSHYDVLISDDDTACRETVGEAVSRLGCRPHLASCGQEAIDYVRHHLIHALIVDMNMPDLTGLDTVLILRQELAQPVPSILMSADASPSLKVRALEAHVDTFVPKPVDLGVLRHVVLEILRRHYEAD